MEGLPDKECMRCGESLPRSEFYTHPYTADGLLGACKACHRAAVKANRAAKREQYSAYESRRWQRPERRVQMRDCIRRRRARSPEKDAARYAVSNAIRDGRLVRGPCAFCGTTVRVQAHHEDYSRPLDVVWACFKCHRECCHGQVVVARMEAA